MQGRGVRRTHGQLDIYLLCGVATPEAKSQRTRATKIDLAIKNVQAPPFVAEGAETTTSVNQGVLKGEVLRKGEYKKEENRQRSTTRQLTLPQLTFRGKAGSALKKIWSAPEN